LRLFIAFWFLIALFSCTYNPQEIEKTIDLEQITKRGKLIVLTENSSLSFYEYRDKQLGFEYEILDTFAKYLGLPLEIKVISESDKLYQHLKNGEGDIVAANICISLSNIQDIKYSAPFYTSPQVLIQRKGKPIKSIEELDKKTVYVRKNSSFQKRLEYLEDEVGIDINIKVYQGDPITEDLIEMVDKGVIDFTVAHENLGRISKDLFSNIDVSTVISFPQKIAFGLRNSSTALDKKLSSFLTNYTKSSEFALLKKRYFDYTVSEIPVQFISKKGALTPFDKSFKLAVTETGWDWKLLAAIAQKESNFNTQAVGMGGSFGIIQFMPATGRKYGVTPSSTVDQQLSAGMKLLGASMEDWKKIPDMTQRVKFTLASYNAGKCHIEDAQKLAKKLNLNPLIWDGHVEKAIMKLSNVNFYRLPGVKCGVYRGHAVYYVRRIFEIYNGYKLMD
jgi:membrane-bound lytic murein transglycosylase F